MVAHFTKLLALGYRCIGTRAGRRIAGQTVAAPCWTLDTLAWATGTHVGAGDHAIALFCIGCGRVLGFLYSDTFTLRLEV